MTGSAPPPALVIGDMDLVRPLGLQGIPCIAAGPTRQETRWSRYTIDGVDLPDLWNEPEDVIDVLVAYGETCDTRPVIVYQKDPAVLALSRRRTAIESLYRIVLPDPETVEDLVDKRRFQTRSDALELPVPRAIFVRPMDGFPEDASDMRFPLVAKPVLRNQTETAWAPVAKGAKALMCATPDDLRRLWDRAEISDVTLALQEYIAGDETQIVSYHAFLLEDQTTIGEFTGRKIRTLPREFGQSTAVEITDDGEARDLGRAVLQAFDFTGVAKVDMKRGEDGRLHVLEVNPRFNLWHHPGAHAGVNIPAAVYRYLVHGDTRPLPAATPGASWIQVWGDARAARERGMSRISWLNSVRRADTRRAAHLDDPGSMLGALAWGMTLRRTQRAHH